ncbi:hypothetical protein BSR29_07030 [Boudabousia liubingyangii]|uniref:DUF3618 domain-containing protein n=1 Tax=Boudabousia liubingyangii TaxID=1921764 RepID=A0A1Q5PK73_9ACTO|nr:DUF3618 domain-containing protein [Boudabousia liubingyangii]OKL46571.1 hypothetical protein BSR29_07030 [Boudabousia liubingyangii]OKL46845.1 hypothetical protein BSR28_05260 [Boudabousia liubingyangii]
MSQAYDFSGSPESIERQLEQIRAEFATNVEALAGRVTPKALAQDAKESAKEKVENTKAAVVNTVNNAKEGDRVAQRNIAIAAAATAAVIGLVAWKIFR